MVAKLVKDSVSADLSAVTQLLTQRTEEEDPVGWLQLTARKNALETELAAIVEQPPATAASVAMFFSGRPAFGSRGVLAEFAGKALEQFQTVVSTQVAAAEGPVGTRGPLPQRERDLAQLIVTDIARGSFGFVLEEANPEGQLLATPTKAAVDSIATMLYRLASPDELDFAAVAEAVDPRVLASLRSFIRLLDDAGATVRVVEEERDFQLPREAIARARQRTENLEISDSESEVEGILYILPDAKRFELHGLRDRVYRGLITADVLPHLIDERGEARPGVIGERWLVNLAVREARSPNKEPRYSYRLVRINESVRSSG